jgi:subfamily B ATP-binding cassette protein MsbA
MGDAIKMIKQLWPYVRPHKRQLWIILLSGIVMAALTPFTTQLVQWLFKAFDAKTPEERAVYRWLPLAFPLLYMILSPARYIHTRATRYTSELVIVSVRQHLLRQFVHLNQSFYNSFEGGSGGLLSRILNDTAVLQDGLNYLVDLIRDPVTSVLLIGWMIYLDWRLTVFTVVMAPLFILLMRQARRSLKKYGHLNRIAMDDVTGTLKESLDGVRVIQSFNLEEKILSRFEKNQGDYLDTRHKIITREEAISPVNEFVASFAFMGLAAFAIHQIYDSQSSAGQFVAFVVAAGLLQPPIKKVQTAVVRMQQALVVCERLFSLLDSQSHVPQVVNPQPFPQDWKTIEFRGVSFSYGSENVLKNINLTIKRGEIIALVGESGSGKSTLVNMLERFFDPTQGEIWIDGTPLNHIQLRDLRHNIALVTQDVFLFRDSIERNILSGDFTKNVMGIEPAARLANAHSFISLMPQAYQSHVGDRGGSLSGGEKQRVSIARAIFKDAPILILDEATSALDSVSEMEVQKGLNHLIQGRTVFMIAHRLSTVFSADRIIVMKKGEIIEQGAHQALLEKKGEYYNFFSLQTQGDRAWAATGKTPVHS